MGLQNEVSRVGGQVTILKACSGFIPAMCLMLQNEGGEFLLGATTTAVPVDVIKEKTHMHPADTCLALYKEFGS